jgi:hypothetical protein
MSVTGGPTSEGNPGDMLGPALKRWADSLVDVTGRNQLLFCKPAGKQSLDRADAAAVAKLLNGQKVMLSDLFPAEGLEAAAKTVNRIRQRIRAYDQDRGIRVGRLTDGFATWDDGPDRTPRAPVLLRHIQISQPVPGIDDYQLRAELDIEVNPVLLHVLAGQVSPAAAVLDEVAELAVSDSTDALAALDRAFSGVRGWRTTPGLLLGTFQYARLPMVDDLTDHGDMFGQSDLVAALAGQQDAVQRVRGTGTPVDRGLPNRTPPADEYLVLDADPSQTTRSTPRWRATTWSCRGRRAQGSRRPSRT